jgi:hypothetical protein
MNKYVIQIPVGNNIVYIYDVETGLLRKICDITDVNEVHQIVLETLKKAELKITVKGGEVIKY